MKPASAQVPLTDEPPRPGLPDANAYMNGRRLNAEESRRAFAERDARLSRATALMLQADGLAAKGKYDEAVALYQKSLEVDVLFGLAYAGMGDALAARGNLDGGLAAYRQLVYSARPGTLREDAPSLFKYALLLCRARCYNEAAQIYDRACSGLAHHLIVPPPALPAHLTPLSPGMGRFTAACELGLARSVRGSDDRQAVAHCRAAVADDPRFALAQLDLGRELLLGPARPAEAVAAFRAAADLDRSRDGEVRDAAQKELRRCGARPTDGQQPPANPGGERPFWVGRLLSPDEGFSAVSAPRTWGRRFLTDYEIRRTPHLSRYMATDESSRLLLLALRDFWNPNHNPAVRYCPPSGRSIGTATGRSSWACSTAPAASAS